MSLIVVVLMCIFCKKLKGSGNSNRQCRTFSAFGWIVEWYVRLINKLNCILPPQLFDEEVEDIFQCLLYLCVYEIWLWNVASNIWRRIFFGVHLLLTDTQDMWIECFSACSHLYEPWNAFILRRFSSSIWFHIICCECFTFFITCSCLVCITSTIESNIFRNSRCFPILSDSPSAIYISLNLESFFAPIYNQRMSVFFCWKNIVISKSFPFLMLHSLYKWYSQK